MVPEILVPPVILGIAIEKLIFFFIGPRNI